MLLTNAKVYALIALVFLMGMLLAAMLGRPGDWINYVIGGLVIVGVGLIAYARANGKRQ